MMDEGYIASDFGQRMSSHVARARDMRVPTKAKSLMTRKVLIAATTVAVALLNVLLRMNIQEQAVQDMVLRIAAWIIGQDALRAEPAPA